MAVVTDVRKSAYSAFCPTANYIALGSADGAIDAEFSN